MLESRKTKIVLPWGVASFDIHIPLKSTTAEVVDMVADKCHLVDKQLFGLAYNNHNHNRHWLMADRKVFEHDFLKNVNPLLLHFTVKFYADTFRSLKCPVALELVCLRAQEGVFKDQIECSENHLFQLASLVLQRTSGDFNGEDKARKSISKLSLTPSFLLHRHPSLSYCEDKIIESYKCLAGMSRGTAIVNILSLVEQLPSYGTHFYAVKDKGGIGWWLGVGRGGLSLYDINDQTLPRKVFEWKGIGNIFYRDKKFCFEIHHNARGSEARDDGMFGDVLNDINESNISNTEEHSWLCESSHLTRSIWCMAVNQHQFFIESSRSKLAGRLRSMEDIAQQLDNTPSLFNQTPSSSSTLPLLNNNTANNKDTTQQLLNSAKSKTAKENSELLAKARERMEALKKRRQELDAVVATKLLQLKETCMQEATLTGAMPSEYPLQADEVLPRVQRRVGTSYSIASNVATNKEIACEEVAQLYLEYELQDKITKAALTLAQDPSVSKKIRKGRLEDYQIKLQKLKWMEDVLKEKVMRSKQAKKVNTAVRSEMRRSCESLNVKNSTSNLYPSYKRHHRYHTPAVDATHLHKPQAIRIQPPLPQQPLMYQPQPQKPQRISSNFKSAPSSPILERPKSSLDLRNKLLPQPNSDAIKASKESNGYHSDNNILDNNKSLPRQRNKQLAQQTKSNPTHQHHHQQQQRQHKNNYNNILKQQQQKYSQQYRPQQPQQRHTLQNHLSPQHSHFHSDCSTSSIVPLSVDPRITRSNLAQSFGLLTLDPQQQHQQHLRQQYFNQQRLNHLFNHYNNPSHSTLSHNANSNINDISISNNNSNYHNNNHNTHNNNYNNIHNNNTHNNNNHNNNNTGFSRSLAYPHLPSNDLESSGSSVSLSSSSTTDPHPAIHHHPSQKALKSHCSDSGFDTHQSSPNLAPYHHNPFFNSPQGSNNNNTSCNINNSFNNNGSYTNSNSHHNNNNVINSPCNKSQSFSQNSPSCNKNNNVDSLINYNNNQNPLIKQQQLQHMAKVTERQYNYNSQSSFSSTNSNNTQHSADSNNTHNYTLNNTRFNNKNSNNSSASYNCLPRPSSAIRNSTLTRNNKINNNNNITQLNNNLLQSRSRRPVLNSSDLTDGHHSNNNIINVDNSHNKSLVNSNNLNTNTTSHNSNNNHIWEDREVLTWYQNTGVDPQPDDQYTLV